MKTKSIPVEKSDTTVRTEEENAYLDGYNKGWSKGFDRGQEKGFKEGGNKKIDDFVKKCEEHIIFSEGLGDIAVVGIEHIKFIAKELKDEV